MYGRTPFAFRGSGKVEFAFSQRQILALLSGLVVIGLLMFFLGVSTGVRLVQSLEQPGTVADFDGITDPEFQALVVEPIFEADEPEPPAAGGEDGPDERASGAGDPFAATLLVGGRQSIANAPQHDVAYYAGGDPPANRGASVDMIIRAFRHAGVDLQGLIHEDIVRSPEAYGVIVPDRNIDYRRVQNLVGFLARHAFSLPVHAEGDWRPGDIVVWQIDRGKISRLHVGILSDQRAPSGDPLVIHHKQRGGDFSGQPSEDDVLFRWPVIEHFRWSSPSS